MRVVGGEARGRHLKPPRDRRIRPTADRIREAIFNLLGPGPHHGSALDLFAGTGALGIEALSRGFARAVFVDRARAATTLIKENLERCRFLARARVETKMVLSFLAGADPAAPFDLVLLDPPYLEDQVEPVLNLLGCGKWVAPGGTVVAECEIGLLLPERVASLELVKRKRYGDTLVHVFARSGSGPFR